MPETILILTNNSSGLYGFRRELIEALQAHGTVIASTPFDANVEDLRALGCTLVETPMERRGVNPFHDFGLMRRYWQILRRVRPDLVITYTVKPNVYGGFLCRVLRIPYAANVTGLGTAFQQPGALRTLITVMYRAALRRAKVVFFENTGNRQTFLDAHIVRLAQCHVLHGAGVNLAHYAPAPYPEESEPVRFLFIGRVMREKGVEELFAAMQRLRAEGFACTLDVLGYYEENFAERIAAYEQAGWLHYHGYQLDVRPFIRGSACFVLPSWHEGMANTLLECGAMGRPLITSRIHGCMEAVDADVTGYLCRVQDAESLYQAMRRFIELPYAQRAAMGAASHDWIASHFDKRAVVAETVAALL